MPGFSPCSSNMNSTRRVSDEPMRSSIHRCLSLNGWSVNTWKPTCSVQNLSARGWSVVGTLMNFTWEIMDRVNHTGGGRHNRLCYHHSIYYYSAMKQFRI